MFSTAIDISNRALDHVGQDPISALTDDSKRAAICGRVYDKLRRAELRRNLWRFATKRAILRAIGATTMLLRPALWGSTTTYFVGSIVADENGQLWESLVPDNLGNQPETSMTWGEYFGPLTVSLYDSTTAYFSGELVYTTAGTGTYRVYRSLQNSNDDNPATATAWDATVTYSKDQVVTRSSVAYLSLIDFNINNNPASAPALWDSGTTYGAAASVGASDGVIYTSIAGSNIGNDPVTDGGVHWTNTGVLNPWTTVFVGGTGSLNWLQIGGAEFPRGVSLASLNVIYPIGAGPSTQSSTRNAYRLPSGFLRATSQDPKAGAQTALGAATGLLYNDWLFEGNYIVTSEIGPIMLRFVADTTDVQTFDDMFCEGLAARMGMEICEPLTQSTDKVKLCSNIYAEHMGTARTVNGIEIGAEEPPMDDYLAVRY